MLHTTLFSFCSEQRLLENPTQAQEAIAPGRWPQPPTAACPPSLWLGPVARLHSVPSAPSLKNTSVTWATAWLSLVFHPCPGGLNCPCSGWQKKPILNQQRCKAVASCWLGKEEAEVPPSAGSYPSHTQKAVTLPHGPCMLPISLLLRPPVLQDCTRAV